MLLMFHVLLKKTFQYLSTVPTFVRINKRSMGKLKLGTMSHQTNEMVSPSPRPTQPQPATTTSCSPCARESSSVGPRAATRELPGLMGPGDLEPQWGNPTWWQMQCMLSLKGKELAKSNCFFTPITEDMAYENMANENMARMIQKNC